jgi:Na+-driven multidrug efflux pump
MVGLPAGMQGTIFSLSNVLIQSSVNSFGDLVMAGNGAAASIEGFTYISMNAVYHASLTFVGQSVGARRYDKINKIVFTCVLCVIVIGLVLGGLTCLFDEPLLSIYLPDEPSAIPYGCERLLIISLPYFICGIMDVLVGAQRGLGLSILPMINSLLGSCVLRVIWIFTVFAAFRSLDILYLSYPITWTITSLAHFTVYSIRVRKIKKNAAMLEAAN